MLTLKENMFQESEIINLVIVFISIPILLSIRRKILSQELRLIYPGFFLILAAYLFTVIEGVFWKDLFNLLEHASYAFAGLLFASGCRSIIRQPKQR